MTTLTAGNRLVMWAVAVLAPALAAAGTAAAVVRGPGPLAVGSINNASLPRPPVIAKPGVLAKGVPVSIELPAIGVSAPMVRLGLDAAGSLEAPWEFGVAGWWAGGVLPGDPGPAVVVGHVDSRTGPAVFAGLRRLAPGDEVQVSLSDGRVVRFEVEALRQYPKSQFPTESVYGPTAAPTLRLVTCGGAFDRAGDSYRDNLIVFARLAPDAATGEARR